MSDDRYARIYFDRIERDPKFDGIRNRRDYMGSWQFLLVEAEKAWPSPAFLLPTSWVPAAHVRLFAERGIIDVTDGRFEMHGLDAIRAERSKQASKAAKARWGNAPGNAPSTAPASAPSMPRQDKTRQDETSNPRGTFDAYTRDGLIHVTPLVAEAWVDASGLTLLGSGAFAMGRIDDACRRHAESKVIAAIHTARDSFDHIPDSAALAIAVRNVLDPLPSAKEGQRAAAEQREADAGRRRVQATKKRTHDLGFHADERDPMCDACTGRAA